MLHVYGHCFEIHKYKYTVFHNSVLDTVSSMPILALSQLTLAKSSSNVVCAVVGIV